MRDFQVWWSLRGICTATLSTNEPKELSMTWAKYDVCATLMNQMRSWLLVISFSLLKKKNWIRHEGCRLFSFRNCKQENVICCNKSKHASSYLHPILRLAPDPETKINLIRYWRWEWEVNIRTEKLDQKARMSLIGFWNHLGIRNIHNLLPENYGCRIFGLPKCARRR